MAVKICIKYNRFETLPHCCALDIKAHFPRSRSMPTTAASCIVLATQCNERRRGWAAGVPRLCETSPWIQSVS